MKTRQEGFNFLEQFLKLISKIERKQSTLLIGVDGCGGSGKSTFAKQLHQNLPDATIVHMDDFYLPSSKIIKKHPTEKPIGADVDWNRVLRQVIEPITQDKEGSYQRYDWETDQLAEWHTVPVGGIVIIEGVYATRLELTQYYDLTVWVETPRVTRLARGIERDGEEAREMWENNWMIAEDLYVETHKPHERANQIVSGMN